MNRSAPRLLICLMALFSGLLGTEAVARVAAAERGGMAACHSSEEGAASASILPHKAKAVPARAVFAEPHGGQFAPARAHRIAPSSPVQLADLALE